MGIRITAVLTTADPDGGYWLTRALESLEGEADEAVAVVPTDHIARTIRKRSPVPIRTEVVDPLPGLSETRNLGADMATGDVVAFLDDDVKVTDGWGDALRVAFRDGAPAAGGPAKPDWEASKPAHLPERWDWLVGCGPYHDGRTEVRNTYGCNIAFDKEIFYGLGGFDEDYGFNDDLGQGEEAELCGRMIELEGRGTEYMPGAEVDHRVPANKASIRRLLERAWAQGRTKARLGLDDEETGFLREAIVGALGEPPKRAAASLSLLAATGLGYLAEKVVQYT